MSEVFLPLLSLSSGQFSVDITRTRTPVFNKALFIHFLHIQALCNPDHDPLYHLRLCQHCEPLKKREESEGT